jgi:hypothetical protein
MKMNGTGRVGVAGALAMAALLSGCGNNQVRTGGADAAPVAGAAAAVGATLEARAEQRWQLLIDGKPELAYDYLSPGYKQTRGRDEYAEITRNKPVKWVGVDFQDQDCDGEVCKVRLMITYTLDMPVQMVGKVESVDFVTENWLWIDGAWYYLPATDAQQGLR